jgi:hypothetical protein
MGRPPFFVDELLWYPTHFTKCVKWMGHRIFWEYLDLLDVKNGGTPWWEGRPFFI